MNKETEKKIDELLLRMTTAEKVGQLVQTGPSIVGAFGVSFEELLNMVFDGRISDEEFQRMMSESGQDYHEEILRQGGIGSYNGVTDPEVIRKLQRIAAEETRMGIPLLFGSDVIHGHRTVYPIPLAESCAWDPQLWEKTARMAAKEASRDGITMTFAPMVDVAKDARWGRISEGAGEDSFLQSVFGAAKVRGFQQDDLRKPGTIVSCVKHFAAYGACEGGRDYNHVELSGERLYEEYLPPFAACIKAGARAVMPAFNDINGIPCTVSRKLLRDILRKELGFTGVTVSDSNAIAECVDHGAARDMAEAAKKALEAGVDIDMSSGVYAAQLTDLVEEGVIEKAVLDEAVREVLRVKYELGLFEQPYRFCSPEESPEKENRALCLESALKSMVLLKNNGLLPLQKNVKVGLIGSLAESRADMLGAWALGGRADDCISLKDALEEAGLPFVRIESDLSEAEDCDAILLAAGETKEMSGEAASRAVISLSQEEKGLIRALRESGKPIILILFNGRPLAISDAAPDADAIVEAWHCGCESGHALVKLLYGDRNFSGHLTTSFPNASGQCPVYYNHLNTGRPAGRGKFTSKYLDVETEPLFPFGFGLSYTEFEEEALEVQAENDILSVRWTVVNTGKRDGVYTAQLYVRDKTGIRACPVLELKAFSQVEIAAGKREEICFELPVQSLARYENDAWTIHHGTYEIFGGESSKKLIRAETEV